MWFQAMGRFSLSDMRDDYFDVCVRTGRALGAGWGVLYPAGCGADVLYRVHNNNLRFYRSRFWSILPRFREFLGWNQSKILGSGFVNHNYCRLGGDVVTSTGGKMMKMPKQNDICVSILRTGLVLSGTTVSTDRQDLKIEVFLEFHND
jgi:hypothetical protein